MSRVYLLRHAKAATAFPGMKDFDRPLATSGLELAARLGAAMVASGLLPEIIIASPSLRTRETLASVAANFPFEVATEFDHALYDGDGDPYLAAIRHGGEAASIMLVGHNPMTEEAALKLCSSGDAQAMAKLRMGFPTGGLAVIDLPGMLAEAEPKCGRLTWFITGGAI